MNNSLSSFLHAHSIDLNMFLSLPLVQGKVEQTVVTQSALVDDRWEFDFNGTSVPVCNEFVEPQSGFVDWVNFVFGIEHYRFRSDFLFMLSDDLESIFGFGITRFSSF